MSNSELGIEFIARSVHHLRGEYLPRIEAALEVLPEEDLWWRANEDTTSVGNLLLHLEGNVRQWILSGLGGADDARERSTEFAAAKDSHPEATARELFAALERTVVAACAVIAGLDDDALLERRTIQVFENVSAMAGVLHVVEHFAWHTGQIAWMAKLRAGAGHGLSYYDDEAL